MGFFTGESERWERQSKLRPGQQEDLWAQLMASLQGEGAGGAYGDVADYYREMMSGRGDAAMEAPLRRQFSEDIIPGIAEQFAGLGAGGLSSGNFVQETGRAGTDLAERLGAMRAGLRQHGAAGLAGLAQGGLNPIDELIFRPRQEGFMEKMAGNAGKGAGAAAGLAMGGPAAAGISAASQFLKPKSGGSQGWY